MHTASEKRQVIIVAIIALVGIGALVAGLVLILLAGDCASSIVVHSKISNNASGAVVTNGHECANIGASIILKNGSAVDAAIAAMFCEGVSMAQSTGLGGGFFMTIFIKSTNEVFHLDAREVAPLAAYEDMYDGNSSISSRGGLSIAVPGELRGYWAAYKRYGRLPWAELVQPTIDLCRSGNLVTPYIARFLKSQEAKLLASPTLREVFINSATNQTWVEGDHIKRETLAKTLEIIAAEGGNALHNGSLTKQFVQDIKDFGGIITEEDMNLYKPRWEVATKAPLPNNHTLYSSPLPGSGVILSFIMNILSGFLDYSQPKWITNYQRIVESFKYGYGKRTELGDPSFVPGIEDLLANLTSSDYAAHIRSSITDDRTFNDPEHYGANTTQPEDHGTAHVAIISPNGDAVSVTGTINLYFGSYLRSPSTGIILNDEMDDFSAPNITNSFDLPPSPANYIKPQKRPLSSMCPSIITDGNGNVRLVIGGAGGSKITTSIAQVIIRHLWYGMPLTRAVEERRMHHQLFPMAIDFEPNFDTTIAQELGAIGHNYSLGASDGFAAITAISKQNNVMEAVWDVRRAGSIAYIFQFILG